MAIVQITTTKNLYISDALAQNSGSESGSISGGSGSYTYIDPVTCTTCYRCYCESRGIYLCCSMMYDCPPITGGGTTNPGNPPLPPDPSVPGGSGSTGNSGNTSSVPSASAVVPFTIGASGQYTRGTVRPITLQTTVFDCSGWVYFVFLNLDPTFANAIGMDTGSIQSYISTHGGYHSIPQVGDLAVWSGHVEFVVGYDGTFVTLSGSRGSNGDSVPTSTGSNYLKPSTMNQIAPNFLGFWTIQ